ncbi:hypothetical protein BJV78DRAFT_1223219 [Lactifluus subvellereus]|nr:hypothetical protein BJV78DRAFT_1223219 [Lactifluus subvellereus]
MHYRCADSSVRHSLSFPTFFLGLVYVDRCATHFVRHSMLLSRYGTLQPLVYTYPILQPHILATVLFFAGALS